MQPSDKRSELVTGRSAATPKKARLAFWGSRDFLPNTAWGLVHKKLGDDGHVWVASTKAPEGQIPRTYNKNLQIFPSDIVDSHYLDIPLTADGIRSFSQFARSPLAAEFRQVVMAMLSRRDNSGTFRVVDRDVVIRRLGSAIMSQLQTCSPTHIIFEETPHEVVDYTLFVLASWLGVKTLFFQPTSMGPQVLPRTAISSTFPKTGDNENTLFTNRASRAAFNESRVEFQRILNSEMPASMNYVYQQMRKSKSLSNEVKKRYLKFFELFLTRGALSRNIFSGHEQTHSYFLSSINAFLIWSLRRSFEKANLGLPTVSPRGSQRYSMFALHYEPERTSLPEGLPFVSQLDAILSARAFLPDDITLIVKEHVTQGSGVRPGYIGRSPLMYDFLKAIPGVCVVGGEFSASDLAGQVELVFTLTGKVGIEMPVRGVPVVYFGNPWWEGIPGTYKYEDGLRFEDLAGFEAPSLDVLLSWFRNFSAKCGFGLGSKSPERFQLQHSSLPDNHIELESASLIAIISQFIGQTKN